MFKKIGHFPVIASDPRFFLGGSAAILRLLRRLCLLAMTVKVRKCPILNWNYYITCCQQFLPRPLDH